MSNKQQLIKTVKIILVAVIGFAAIASGALFSSFNHYFGALIIILSAVGLYFYEVLFIANKNWMDIRAVFTGMWLGTIGLASLRLMDYQEPWQIKTWILLATAYAMIQLGASVGMLVASEIVPKFYNKISKISFPRSKFKLQENRLFPICVITTIIGLLCFAINVAIRGYIPCFSSAGDAYINFYTKFHIFAVAATSISGLCYYCIKTQKLSIWKKIVMGLCIFYSTFAFPILVVSRGTFVVSALSLTVGVFYLHKKKLLVLIACLIAIAGIYSAASELRGYTNEQLKVFFEPSEIPISSDASNDTSDSTNDDTSSDATSSDNTTDTVTFSLSPKLSFIYSYLTVSHDNFNEAVQNSTEYTYGLRQFAPFNVILRSDWIEKTVNEAEHYLVRPHLNTTNVVGDFYYDFHEWGIIFCVLIWAFIFGIIQKAYEICSGPFTLLVLSNTMIPIALCFFSTWLSLFSHWMLWGVVLIYAFAACVNIKPKKSNS